MNDKITAAHRARNAVVYVRQSTMEQVRSKLESQRRQDELGDRARELGFARVEIIDDDLGKSGSGTVERPGFQRLVAAVCTGEVGAVLCIEASRLARNGRDWHHLVDLCALTGSLLIDADGVYDPRLVNDRLLLGLKGTMSEFELTILSQRSREAAKGKARRGELQFQLPIGLVWSPLGKVELDPDRRVQDAIRSAFAKFDELGSIRQSLLWFRDEGVHLPVRSVNRRAAGVRWQLPRYHNLHSIITNPIYAGAYAYGRTEVRKKVVDGRARQSTGHRKPRTEWMVLLREHHVGYIDWSTHERNLAVLVDQAHAIKDNGRRAGRGGHALLTGLLRCRRCGRRLRVAYAGKGTAIRYWCAGEFMETGRNKCISFGGWRVDRAVGREVLRAVDGPAIEAAIAGATRLVEAQAAKVRAIELELEQTRYEARVAARRYDQVDPDNRLVASELEARWNQALKRVSEVEMKREECQRTSAATEVPSQESLLILANDLPAIWHDPETDNRLKQRIVRVLLREAVVDLNDARNEVDIVLHWAGGAHTAIAVARRQRGDSVRSSDPEAIDIVRRMAGRWTDTQIARTLHRVGLRTGAGNTWTDGRIRALRSRLHLPAVQQGPTGFLTLEQAAARLGISGPAVRKLVMLGVVPATQVVPGAPWEIQPQDLELPTVQAAVDRTKIEPRGRKPRKISTSKSQEQLFL